ncbi:MAG: radical SAM family heme chaperone HemW [Chromatiales bacterium]|nr:radical SAM family heme chaperone HemW [Chromatiales bacterium]
MLNLSAPPPLTLYIHYPWCVRKCPYCDFNSHQVGDGLSEAAYLEALLRDLEQHLPAVWGRPIHAIFIGGGTPSLLSPQGVDQLLSQLRALLPLSAECEVTMEANPGTVEQGRFSAFREAGVNRLSIGIQSFNDGALQRLGRIHSGAEAIAAVEAAHAAGFDNLNLDLMFGLPGQSESAALADLTQAVSLTPTHLSWYQLTIEPNTAFAHSPPRLPEDEAIWDIQIAGQAYLAEKGYGQYEVSAYARPGRRCRHNLNYWRFGDYLGIGPGAHGKITHCAEGRIERVWKKRHPREWLEAPNRAAMVAGHNNIPRHDLVLEFMMNGLRLVEGFDVALFSETTGLPITAAEVPLSRAVELRLLEWDVERIVPTPKGRDHLNQLLAMFLPEE